MSGQFQCGYVPQVEALIARIGPLVPDRRLPYPRWISTPDGDQGSEWCADCGYYKVRNMRRRDPKRAESYILDGGWRTEEDSFKFCAGCGVRLDVCPTEHNVEESAFHYAECGFTTDPGEDAYEINEMLHTVAYVYGEDKQANLRQSVVAVAEAFLAHVSQTERPA